METVQVTPGKMLVSVVEEVDEISEEDAQHIQMFFGCAKCKTSFSDAKEVLQHVRTGQCPGNKSISKTQQNQPQKQSSVGRRGRPRKIKATDEEASPMKKAKKNDNHDEDFTPPSANLPTGRRATRVSTGVMKRKSILDIIGEASARKDAKLTDPHKNSSSDEGETPKRRGPGRPRKHPIQPAESEEMSFVVTITENGIETEALIETLQGNVAPNDENADAEQPADIDDSDESAVADGDPVVEEADGTVVTEEADMIEDQAVAESTSDSQNAAESSEAIVSEVTEQESTEDASAHVEEEQLMDDIGDGDDYDDDDEYLLEEEQEEDAAVEDQEYDEEMDLTGQEIDLGDQLAHARVTQMGETKVIEIFPSLSQKIAEDAANRKPEPNISTVTKLEKPKYEEPEEDIELTLEDLQDDDYRDSNSRRKSQTRIKKDIYRGCGSKYVPKRPLRCPICPQRFFMTKEELDMHVSCHVEKPTVEVEYACPDCPYQTKLWNRCLDHLISHPVYREKFKDHDFVRNILGQYECPVCKKKFDRKNNMKGHLVKVHHKSSKTCSVCQQVFEGMDEKTFGRHVERCKCIEHCCPHCKYKTVVSENYRKHIKIHNGTGFTCPVCSKIFPTKSRFRCHLNTHDQNRPKTVCELCGQEFKTEDAAKKHILRNHAEVSEIYQCFKCNFTAKVESDLKKHINSVHFKKYTCEHCDYSTNSESAMEQHKHYHGPGRRFACSWENCFYAGPTPKHLTNHMCQVHQPFSKHQCPVCLKCYKKKTHLARHLVVHTGEKPYVCMDCNEAFASHSTYYRHRARTGHDAKREGIVSVPQNIHIQYVNQDHTDVDGLVEENIVPVEGIETTVEQTEDMILTCEEVEADQLTYFVHIDENGQQVMVPATEEDLVAIRQSQEEGQLEGHVHEIVEGNEDLLQEGQMLLQQFEAGAFPPQEQANVIVQEQTGDIEQVQEESAEQLNEIQQVEMIDGDVSGVQADLITDPQTDQRGDQVIIQETVTMDPGAEDKQFIYQDADGSVHTVVEVETPSDNNQQQYAILVLPEGKSSGAEPEAALSMLQLQSSMQQ